MEKHTTEDCKNLLFRFFPLLHKEGWKRISKHKDDEDMWVRNFQHDKGTYATIREGKQGLEFVSEDVVKSTLTNSAQYYIENRYDLTTTDGQSQLNYSLFGSGDPSYIQHLTPHQHFIKTLNDGLDWSLPETQRSTYDLFSKIDVNLLTQEMHQQGRNLLEDYFSYMAVHFNYLLDQEDAVLDHILVENFDDSVADLKYVLHKIISANDQAGLSIELSEHLVDSLYSSIDMMLDSLGLMEELFEDPDEDEIDEAKQSLSSLKQLISQYA